MKKELVYCILALALLAGGISAILTCAADVARADGGVGFGERGRWSAYDAGRVKGLETKGYFGAAFDGRYVYFAPCRMGDFHGTVLRFDTTKEFRQPGGWESYDASRTGGRDMRGFSGAVFDGRYVYFVPFATMRGRHARVLRYDTKGGFGAPSSWSAFDAQAVAGRRAMGYVGAAFDGRYVYFSPFGFKPYAHAFVLRLDTKGEFTAPGSWSVYDGGRTGGLNTKGYYGAAFDGRYVYFVPFNDGASFHGRVLRCDTSGEFTASSSWSAYDAGRTDGMTTVGCKGAGFDGRYVYFVPFREGEDVHGRVLRLDTKGSFTAPSSWSAYDAGRTGGLDTRGYIHADFDGRYLYFVPYSGSGQADFHGRFLRLDAKGDFKSPTSWSAFDGGAIDGLVTKGYKYSAYDGRYVYFAPYHDGKGFSGTVVRYDTKSR